MSHVFEASIRGDSGCFIYVSVKKGDRAGVLTFYPTCQIFLPGLTAHAHINISS